MKTIIVIRTFTLLTICIMVFIPASGFSENNPDFYEGLISVKLKAHSGSMMKTDGSIRTQFGISSIDRMLSGYNILKIENRVKNCPKRTEDVIGISRIYKVRFGAGVDRQMLLDELNRDPNVEYAESIPINYMDATPNDSLFSEQQHLPQIQAEQAWNIHKGEDGAAPVVIGISDDAVNWRHPDLVANVWQNMGEDADKDGKVIEFVNGKWIFDPDDENGADDDGNGYVDDFVGWDYINAAGEQDNDPDADVPELSHGTHVTGIAAGVTNNGTGIASISYNVKFMSLKHDADGENPYDADPYQGVIYAADNGADIINMSWGSAYYSKTNEDFIRYAYSKGALPVTSAGNENNAQPHYPSNYPFSFSVASVNVNDVKASYSSYGISVDISAPGGEYATDGAILSTVPGGYDRYNGTSMSSPLVAGLFGLIKSQHPDWSQEQLITQMIGTADDISDLNKRHEYDLGYGRINAFRALSETDVVNPPLLKLDVDVLPPQDDNNNQALEPGEKAMIGLRIRNWAPFAADDAVGFTLVSNDADISVLQNQHTGAVAADSAISLDKIFEIQVSSSAKAHVATLRLKINSKYEIMGGSEFFIKLLISADGLLVWEEYEDDPNSSGKFIHEFLTAQGYQSVYINDYPHSLIGFDAVFLCFGARPDRLVRLDKSNAIALSTYMARRGDVYFEGEPLFENNNVDNFQTVFRFMGISAINYKDTDKIIRTLNGAENSLAENMSFPGSTQPIQRPVTFTTGNGANVLFREIMHGTVGFSCVGTFKNHTVGLGYAISQLVDGNLPSTRYRLLSKILEYYELLPADYYVADFKADHYTGHGPATIQFTDLSFAMPDQNISKWAWDFDGDGITDSEEQNPEWTYNQSGEYGISFQSAHALPFTTSAKRNTVYTLNGTSAMLFNNGSTRIKVNAAPDLNLQSRFTVEAWIYPYGWGENGLYGFGRIIDKDHISIFLHDNEGIYNTESLILGIYGPDDAFSAACSPKGSIHLNQWSHIAVSYDAAKTEARMLINGEEQTLTYQYEALGAIHDNASTDLYVGNRENYDRCFNGVIDELKLWNTIPTAEEIRAGMPAPVEPQEGLIGFWQFDEGTGETATDLSGKGHDGVIQVGKYVQNTSYDYTTSLKHESSMPDAFALLPNFPNPFNPVTNLRFALPAESRVTVRIYNILGREVNQINLGIRTAGYHQWQWNGSDCMNRSLPAGVYFYRIEARTKTQHWTKTHKMVMIK